MSSETADSDAPVIPQHLLDALFPLPTRRSSHLLPTVLFGATSESGATLMKLLKTNHEKFHMYFNDMGFHNHTSHHLLANYVLGASPSGLEAAYAVNASYQRKAFKSPEEITETNWKDHLQDRSFYSSYLRFFTKQVLQHGSIASLEKYIFSIESNYLPSKADDKQPKMLDRFLSGFLHPMIHVGYAVEFDCPGMMAEGLAMTCTTEVDCGGLIPRSLFTGTSALESLTSSISLYAKSGEDVTAFNILDRVSSDPALDLTEFLKLIEGRGHFDYVQTFKDTVQSFADIIAKHVSGWSINSRDSKNIEAKIEELSWLVTLLYGVAGLQTGKEFKADFFLMHLVTSSLFLPSFAARISPSSQVILMKSYLAFILLTWISRGKPAISLSNFYAKTSTTITPPGPTPPSNKETLDAATTLYPNPWLPLLQSTLMHPNEHYPKIQRAFSHFAEKYGLTPKGHFTGKTDLDDAQLLDGTVFIRVAALTANSIGWVREGEEKGEWDFSGFVDSK